MAQAGSIPTESHISPSRLVDSGVYNALRAQIDAAGWTVLDTKDGAKIVKKA